MAKANVMIDNDKTRVTEWSFEVGDETGQHVHEYDYVVVNDDLTTCYNKILNIIKSEKNGEKANKDFTQIKKKIIELVE